MAKKASNSWKEERRKRAWVLYRAGWPQKQIAEAMDVTKGAVSQWIKAGKEGGEAALKSPKSTGSPSRLSTEEWQRILGLLERGAESFGFRGDLWTCPRVAKVIEGDLGVKYQPAQVSRILKELGWTPQKPFGKPNRARKLRSRDGKQNAGQSGKKAAQEGRTIVFIDKSGFYLLPIVVWTYAP
jgi:transposase